MERGRGVLLVALVLAVAACGGGAGPQSGAHPADPTAPPPPAVQSPAPSTATAAARCHTSGVALVAIGQPDAGAGNRVQEFGLTNRTAAACWVYGYPGMALIDAAGNQLPTRVVRDPGTRFPFARVGQYTVPSGATAPFWVHWGQVPVDNETTCTMSAGLIVTPPDETTQVRLDGVKITACNRGQLDVSPMTAPGTKGP